MVRVQYQFLNYHLLSDWNHPLKPSTPLTLLISLISRQTTTKERTHWKIKFTPHPITRKERRSKMPKRKRNKEDGTKKDVKYKGVYKRGERFAANIRTDGSKIQYLGTYDTAKEAAEVYDLAAIQAGRPTSKLNFLDQVPKKYKPKNNGLSSTNTTQSG